MFGHAFIISVSPGLFGNSLLTKEEQGGKKKRNAGMSRRRFLAGTFGGLALGAAAGATTLIPQVAAATPPGERAMALSGLGAKQAAEAQVPTNWAQTADVVVVGYGGAGAVSAITAYDAGANVLILEKTPSYAALGVINPAISGGGGSTSMNGGRFDYPSDP